MRYLFLLIACSCMLAASAQQVRIVDTLSAAERTTRNPVLLRAELDSLIAVYGPAPSRQPVQQPVVEQSQWPLYAALGGIAALLIIASLLYFLLRSQQRSTRTIHILHKQVKHLDGLVSAVDSAGNQVASLPKGKNGVAAPEKKIQYLTTQLDQARKSVEEFEGLKQQMTQVYKLRNYPGFSKEKTEIHVLKDMLETERSVALYAYEHFLKPVIAVADANKNNPARISAQEREKMLDLLISLGLLYSEYLYLRVSDLAVGGNIVERIASFKNGNVIDLALLKELNTDHGSRALALRIALDKMGIHRLSYPVFEETNLNLS
jgi:hypothetical protein